MTLSELLAMGGYARFVWPCYGLAALVMAGLLVWVWRGLKGAEAELARLQQDQPVRRRARPAAAGPSAPSVSDAP